MIACCEGLTEGRVDATLILNRPGDLQYPERAQDVLAHLFQHDIHHRGLAGTAVPPPQLDAFFLRRDAPLRAQEMRALVFAGS